MSKKNEQATETTNEQAKKPIPLSPEPSHGVAPMWTDWPEGVEPDDSEETDESDESTDDTE